jgi:hypothetical protein
MKRALSLLVAVTLLLGLTGCLKHHLRGSGVCTDGSCAQGPEGCPYGPSADGAGEGCPCREYHGPGYFNPGCGGCGGCLGKNRGAAAAGMAEDSGPPSGAVTYPYYTVRGPRDFLARNPRSIGP